MKEIESKLPSSEFIRIQRSFIVRVDNLSIEDNYGNENKEIHIGKAAKKNKQQIL